VVPDFLTRAVRGGGRQLGEIRLLALRHRAVQVGHAGAAGRAELVRNESYWNKDRLPHTERLMLICTPEDLVRSNALLTGQADLIETPAPMRSRG
jgi:hypothetical protein